MARETDKRWKGFLIDWPTIEAMDSEDYELKPLNQRQVAVLLMLLEYQKWPTRWTNLELTRDELGKFIGDIEERLMRNEVSPMSCGDVEDCLETSVIIGDINSELDDLDNDVESIGSGNAYKPSSPAKPLDKTASYPQLSGDIVEPESGCNDADKDRLWATIKALVYRVHNYNLSLFNTFTNYNNPSEAYDMLSAFLPIIGGIAPTTANALAVSLSTNFKTSYTAAVTDSFLMDVVEDLFCAAYGDCSFKLEDFIAYVANMAGGSYNAAVTTFLDVTSALAGATTGSAIYGAVSWWQFHVLGLSEKFGISPSIPNIINSISGALPDGSWKAYATECYTPSGTWTIVIDLAGDYVATGSEVVYRNGFSYVKPSTTASQGTASLTNSYGVGMTYNAPTNTFANRELRIANNTALFQTCRLNARKTGGSSTNMLIDAESNVLANAPRQITSASFAWTANFPVGNVSSLPTAITIWKLNFNQTLSSNSCIGDLRYIEFVGTGDLPIFN